MKFVKIAFGAALVLVSAYMLFNGAIIFAQTSGGVRGTEFQMLIVLANQLSLIMLWLGLFAAWAVVPTPKLNVE